MRLLNVQFVERKHDLHRFRVRPADRDMQVSTVKASERAPDHECGSALHTLSNFQGGYIRAPKFHRLKD